MGMHCPSSHICPAGQIPQDPPQPSGPHALPSQAGTQGTTQASPSQVSPSAQQIPAHSVQEQMHWNVSALQAWFGPHVPQVAPHPLSPHALPSHWGWHSAKQALLKHQGVSTGQVPQVAPQPSSPQAFPSHAG